MKKLAGVLVLGLVAGCTAATNDDGARADHAGLDTTPPVKVTDDPSFGDILGISKDVQDLYKTASTVIGGVAAVYSGVGEVIAAAQLLGILSTPQSATDQMVTAINQKLDLALDAIFQGFGHVQRTQVDAQHGVASTARTDLATWLKEIQLGQAEDPHEQQVRADHDAALQTAIDVLSADSFHTLPYDPRLTGGRWTTDIPDRPDHPNGYVFDPRLALPALVDMITVRMLWMAAIDPDFSRNGHFAAELEKYEGTITHFLSIIEGGIRCTPRAPDEYVLARGGWPMGCADIYTGTYEETNWWTGWNDPPTSDLSVIQARWYAARDRARDALERAVGIPELVAFRDRIHSYRQPVAPFVLSGRFDFDRRADIALVGGAAGTVQLALSNGDGTFRNVAHTPSASEGRFAAWANMPGVRAVAGDFDGDGRTDVALLGGDGWTNVKVAFSNGDGSFTVADDPVFGDDAASFTGWARAPGAQIVAADFDGDGKDDIAMAGGAGWWTVPVARSLGRGAWSFFEHNAAAPDFTNLAQARGARLIAGKFGDDGQRIGLTGGPWSSIPIAKPGADGSLSDILNSPTYSTFPSHAIGATPVVGDFDGNGFADIAALRKEASAIPIAQSFGIKRMSWTGGSIAWLSLGTVLADAGDFPGWATQHGATPIAGDFDGDGKDDIALTGVDGWWTIPVAFSTGTAFSVTNAPNPSFADVAVQTRRPR